MAITTSRDYKHHLHSFEYIPGRSRWSPAIQVGTRLSDQAAQNAVRLLTYNIFFEAENFKNRYVCCDNME